MTVLGSHSRPDTVPHGELFPACVEVLEEKLMPLHYKRLAAEAIIYLGLEPERYHLAKVAEDVRQWLPERFPSVLYTGALDYMMMMRYWLMTQHQTALNLFDAIPLPTSANAAFEGAYDALLRSRWTQAKKEERSGGDPRDKPFKLWDGGDWRRYINICERQAKGKSIEAQFVYWARKRWPSIILDPENAGEYDKPCGHDFRIINPFKREQVYTVDVAGEGIFGEYGCTPYGKPKADIHICCRLDRTRDSVMFDGLQTRRDFGEYVSREYVLPPQVFVVWMNCWQAGIRYFSLGRRQNEHQNIRPNPSPNLARGQGV